MPIINTIGNASGRAYGFTRGGGGKILISSTPGPAATITTYSGYIVFKFTASATLNVGAGSPGTADALLVAGGTNGTNGTAGTLGSSGPGGPGGKVNASPAVSIVANSPIPIVVGGSATNSTFGPLSSSTGVNGGAGGSGFIGPTSTPSQPGSNGPTNDYLTGSPQFWSGGGGGAYPGSPGGQAGGGTGGSIAIRPIPGGGPIGNPGGAGTANTGGGGGGGSFGFAGAGSGGAGGSGIVIVRFPDVQFTTS